MAKRTGRKRTAKQAPSRARAAKRKPAGSDEVTIRMYRQGLGDCFLLTFGPDAHLLIDCGLLAGTPDSREKITAVAHDISATSGKHLRALVVTHEHWDHVSGFADARDVFEGMTIDETWVAWTEDPAQDLITEKKNALAARFAMLHAAASRLAQSGDPEATMRASQINETLGFLGERPDGSPAAALATGGALLGFSPKTDEAMSWATHRDRKPRFWSPGDTIERAWMPGVRVHVLGPPKDKKALKRMDGEIGTDMYGMAFGMSGEELGIAMGLAEGSAASTALPFDPALQWRDESRWLKEFHPDFQEEYKGERWRRADHDWLGAAEGMALQLDNAINNTSLVLAFEFGEGGEVLLFVGDAQVGNWKSWVGGAKGLLRRTVLYKVGHHASHNATLKEGGLEEMTHEDLVALIPVDEKAAKAKRPYPWMMPADELYERLKKRTKGRILRADQPAPAKGSKAPKGATVAEWKAFVGSVEDDRLHVMFRCRPRRGT